MPYAETVPRPVPTGGGSWPAARQAISALVLKIPPRLAMYRKRSRTIATGLGTMVVACDRAITRVRWGHNCVRWGGTREE